MKHQLTIRLDESILDKLKSQSKDDHRSLNELIVTILQDHTSGILIKSFEQVVSENTTLRNVMTTVMLTMKNNGMNTGHWKKHVDAMSKALK